MNDREILLKLGAKVRYERTLRKLSQESLAEQAGLEMRTISTVENGHHNVKFLTIYKIAKAFGIEISDLTNFKL